MTDVERYSPEVETTLRGDPASELVAWARAAEAAAELARPLAQTAFVPEVYQGKPGDAAAAILVGAEVGLSPMQALQGIYVIKGKPAMYARTLMAIVLATGHEVWTEKSGPERCVVKGRRRGSERVETSEWSIGRARDAGYTNNAKYKTDPESMLLARAQAELCRRLAPDAILGMAYTVEELEEDEQPAAKRTVSRKTKPAPDPASAWDEPKALEPGRDQVLRPVADLDLPPLPGEVVENVALPADPEPPAEATPEQSRPAEAPRAGGITPRQSRMMMALLNTAGLSEREDRLDLCQTLTGRELTTSNDLTKGEAQTVIDHLLVITGQVDDPEPGFDEPDAEPPALPYKDD